MSVHVFTSAPWRLTTALPLVLIFILFLLFMRQLQAGGGKAMSFGKSRAKLLSESLGMGEVTYLSPGEVELMSQTQVRPLSGDRAWEYWARRAGC